MKDNQNRSSQSDALTEDLPSSPECPDLHDSLFAVPTVTMRAPVVTVSADSVGTYSVANKRLRTETRAEVLMRQMGLTHDQYDLLKCEFPDKTDLSGMLDE